METQTKAHSDDKENNNVVPEVTIIESTKSTDDKPTTTTKETPPTKPKKVKLPWNEHMRMDKDSYQNLLKLVTPEFEKSGCTMDPKDRLDMALKYLGSGVGLNSPEDEELIAKTCLTFVEVLGEDYLKVPTTAPKWRKIATTFERWGFPNCLSTISAMRIPIVAPPGLEDLYRWENDDEPTMMFMAGVDGDFKFTWAEFGLGGQVEEEEMFVKTSFYERWQKNLLDLPGSRTWPEKDCTRPIDYTFVGGNFFCLRRNMVVPMFNSYVEDEMEAAFNKCVYKALKTITAAFGLLLARFGMFDKPIGMEYKTNAISTVLVCCVLHNYLISRNPKYAEEYKDRHLETEEEQLEREYQEMKAGWEK